MKDKQRFTGLALVRGAVMAVSVLLFGCQQATPPQRVVVQGKPMPVEPPMKVVDYLAAPCHSLWATNQPEAMINPLYWLRASECAARLSPAEARAAARDFSASDWQNSFRQAILLSNGNVTPLERRQYMVALDNYSVDIPRPVRPMWLLWRDNQQAQLQLSEERGRYATLQEQSDTQLDTLRQKQIALTHELNVTRRKLESLTDIERQLSTRKSASDLSDAPRTSDQRSSSDALQADEIDVPSANPAKETANP